MIAWRPPPLICEQYYTQVTMHASYGAHEVNYARALIAWSSPPQYASNDTRELRCTRATVRASYDARELCLPGPSPDLRCNQ